MTEQNDTPILQKIKKTHERIAIIAGVIMGVMLSSYFFTFGMLIDRDATGALWFQIITSVLFIFGLIFLKRLAFFLTKLILGFKSDYREALTGMKVSDLDKI
jgi:F0F1-type ATP synthase assembly protein I